MKVQVQNKRSFLYLIGGLIAFTSPESIVELTEKSKNKNRDIYNVYSTDRGDTCNELSI